MQELISAILIAIVQGLTEWIPVSSSGHLVVVERLLNYEGGLFFNVALHFGTLMAVFVYFGREITEILGAILKGRWKSDNSRLGFLILVATIPAAVVGFSFQNAFESAFQSLAITALGFGVTGLFLVISSFNVSFGKKGFGWMKALGVGVAQIFALFPGVSRSGMTIGSGSLFGLKEKDAIKFSFLMSIPIIFGANIVAIGNESLPSELVWATLVSFAVGLGAIHVLYKYILTTRKNLRYFGAYALLLALVLGVFLLF